MKINHSLNFHFTLFIISILSFSVQTKSWGQTPYVMSGGDYSETFTDIANTSNWQDGFGGADCAEWGAVGVITAGAIPDPLTTTKSSATWVSGTTGGLQRGTAALQFLSTGTGAYANAVAVDLFLDFTSRTAGTLSFDWSAVDNASGTRPSSLRVYWSVNGTSFTELTDAQVLEQVSASSGSITTIALPEEFNDEINARLRFYQHTGTATGSGNRDFINIDNIAITSTVGVTNPTAQAVPYSEDFSALTHVSTTFPDGWEGWKVATAPGASYVTTAPLSNVTLTASATAAGASAAINNYDGKIGFLNSGSNDFSLVLALNTSGYSNLAIDYDVMTIRNPHDAGSNTRVNEVSLQYRIGKIGSFTTIAGYEYQNNTTTQTTGVTTPQNSSTKTIILPAACDNEALVQLRWVSLQSSGGGSRPSFAIDNVDVYCAAPTTQASSIGFSNVTSNLTTISWTRGNGTGGVIVLAKSGGAVNEDPANSTSYTADANLGDGEELGTGNYVVYIGTGTSVNVTGLDASTTYYYEVFEYHSGCIIYNTTGLTGNQATLATASTDYFQSTGSGNWSSSSTWQSSPDNTNWGGSSSIPTSDAQEVVIQTGHTITIDGNISASGINIEGTGVLIFDGAAARDVIVTGDITISNDGSFITQAAGVYSNTMSVGGNITNSGVFDMSRGGTTLVCNVTFNKDGNQTVSGTGATTRFNKVTINMGTSQGNTLEISSTNFAAADDFMHFSGSTPNELLNGTIKLSGTYTFSNAFFLVGESHSIVATAGIWLNNPNVTITATADSWDLYGLLRVSNGTINIGTLNGNCLRANGSAGQIIIEGGVLNVAARICPKTVATDSYSYNQSGGTVNLVTVASGAPNLAAFDMSHASSSFTMSGGTIIIMDNNINATPYLDYYNIASTHNVTGGTVQFGNASSGDAQVFKVNSSADMPSISISNATAQATKPKVLLYSNIQVNGDITIASSTTLDVSKDGGTTNYDIALTGDWSNSGTFTHRSKTVTFNGSAAQAVASNGNDFGNVTINNTVNPSGTDGVVLSDDMVIASALTLTDGSIITGTDKVEITSNSDVAVVAGGGNSNYTNSFIYGNLRRYIAAATSSNYAFPVGTETDGRLAILKGNTFSVAGNYLDAFFTTTIAGGTTLPGGGVVEDDITYDAINSAGSWQIDASGGVTNTYDMYLYIAGFSGLINNRFTILKRSSASTDAADWDVAGGTINAEDGDGRLVSNGYSLRKGFNTFSLFSVSTSSTPLPVTLIGFNAECIENSVLIKWSTASEINNDYFTIEKSVDGENFEFVANVKGAGNSNEILHYSLVDENPFWGYSYYRLKQTDFDGTFSFSNIETIKFEDKLSMFNINVFPNPVKQDEDLKIKLTGEKDEEILIVVQDILGKVKFSKIIVLESNQYIIGFDSHRELSTGIYMVTGSSKNHLQSKKIVIK